MVSSMTGFGEAQFNYKGNAVKIEIRALNGKNTDLRLRVPPQYRKQDLVIRKLVLSSLKRGKIDFTTTITNINGQTTSLNKPLIKAYISEILEIHNEMDIEPTNVLSNVFSIPKLLEENEMELEEEEIVQFTNCMQIAIDNLIDFRRVEGVSLYKDLEDRLGRIVTEQNKVNEFIEERDKRISDRLKKKLLSSFEMKQIDENRFEQEIIFYLDKLDLNEELVRLEQHCKYFHEILNNDDEVKGKKLGFIAQEMGREINTLGSKAQFADIQRLVVIMKDDLEKIKEQLANLM